jgi:hypothetical protein
MAEIASENWSVILTRFAFVRSGTMATVVAVGAVVSITTDPKEA